MKYILCFMLLAFSTAAYSQIDIKKEQVEEIKVERQAQFPGGNIKINDFLSKNITYPEDAREQGVEGRVLVTFVIAEDGKISDAKVAKKVHPSLDAAALAAVKKMPVWEPALVEGKPIKSMYTIPVIFQLTNN
jgi:TonB family protein